MQPSYESDMIQYKHFDYLNFRKLSFVEHFEKGETRRGFKQYQHFITFGTTLKNKSIKIKHFWNKQNEQRRNQVDSFIESEKY